MNVVFTLQGLAGMVDVVVMQESIKYTYNGFNFDASLTPTVSSIVPSTVGVGGKLLCFIFRGLMIFGVGLRSDISFYGDASAGAFNHNFRLNNYASMFTNRTDPYSNRGAV